MKKELIAHLQTQFDSIVNILPDSNIEFWYARNLQNTLGYVDWRNFLEVIDKARTACSRSGIDAADHFVDVNKMVKVGSGS